MATVYDVAKYVLRKTGKITTMKLQKIVYYCQAWSLAWDDVPLFKEDFEAWANGPVCPKLFERHKGKFVVDERLFKGRNDYDFSINEIETMDKVIEYYGDRDPQWLSELTHKEAPWKHARKGCAPGQYCTTNISKEDMRQYYGGL